MLLRDLVETSAAVAATRSRKAKVAAISERRVPGKPAWDITVANDILSPVWPSAALRSRSRRLSAWLTSIR